MNDQFREGSWIHIAETEMRYCPISLLKHFIQVGEHSTRFLFVQKNFSHEGRF